jgi:adenylate cyclase
MKSRQYSRKFELSIPRKELWNFLIETDKINRFFGFPPMTSTPSPQKNLVIGSWRILGFTMSWEEPPFEWLEPIYLFVQRNPLNNFFLKKTSLIFSLEESKEEQTTLEIALSLETASFLPNFVIEKILDFLVFKRYAHLLRFCEENYKTRKKSFTLPSPRPRLQEPILKNGLNQLKQKPVSQKLIPYLEQHIRTAPDKDCINMRPFVLADAWQEDRLEVLRLFLYATTCGLLEMKWEILCPNCRIFKGSVASLSQLKQKAHCETCQIEFNINFDQYVELCFSIHPAIRKISGEVFCLGNPANTPHVVMQLRIPPKAEKTAKIFLPEGSFQLWNRRDSKKIPILVQTKNLQRHVSIIFGEKPKIEVREIKEKESFFYFKNNTENEILVLLEKTAWDERQVTAAFVTSLQEFGDLFPSQVLAHGVGLEIKNLAILFSDLKGSTALYQKLGDAKALNLVWEHFSFLASMISKHHGRIVKTMGDALMAVFLNTLDGLAACVEIEKTFKSDIWKNKGIGIKLGLHCGPCIAVNGNDGIDYFGTTVNVASRLQSLNTQGGFVFTQAVLEYPGVEQFLKSHGISIFAFQENLKGLPGQFQLYSLNLDSIPV